MKVFKTKEKKELKNKIYAPVSGKIVHLEEVNDPVFNQKLVGDGIAIKPNDNTIYCPTSGTIEILFPTMHAIGISSNQGAKILLHIGIDTVSLNGKGFTPYVKQGDKVKAFQKLMKIDLDTLGLKKDMTTIILIENYQDYQMKILKETEVHAKEELIELD